MHRPRTRRLVHILVTLRRFDHFEGRSLNQDHLFLVREGWPKPVSWKSQVMHSWSLFETGTMAGLIEEKGLHSGIYTNFRIFRVESRLYWPWEACCGCGSHRCAEGPEWTWSACGDTVGLGYGTGWALAIPILHYRLGTTPPPTTGWVLPLPPNPGYRTPPHPDMTEHEPSATPETAVCRRPRRS